MGELIIGYSFLMHEWFLVVFLLSVLFTNIMASYDEHGSASGFRREKAPV